ncbi:MAG: hypothetical protein ACOC6D_04870 [Atribacterota bacterium]
MLKKAMYKYTTIINEITSPLTTIHLIKYLFSLFIDKLVYETGTKMIGNQRSERRVEVRGSIDNREEITLLTTNKLKSIIKTLSLNKYSLFSLKNILKINKNKIITDVELPKPKQLKQKIINNAKDSKI